MQTVREIKTEKEKLKEVEPTVHLGFNSTV